MRKAIDRQESPPGFHDHACRGVPVGYLLSLADLDADDIALLLPNTVSQSQTALGVVEVEYSYSGLELNDRKTMVLTWDVES